MLLFDIVDTPHFTRSSVYLPYLVPSVTNDVDIKNISKEKDIVKMIDSVRSKGINLRKDFQTDRYGYNPPVDSARRSSSQVNYWTDWFGKPGNGAPGCTAHKQNLSHMLEPPRSKTHELDSFRSSYGDLKMRRFDSNHHNSYQLN